MTSAAYLEARTLQSVLISKAIQTSVPAVERLRVHVSARGIPESACVCTGVFATAPRVGRATTPSGRSRLGVNFVVLTRANAAGVGRSASYDQTDVIQRRRTTSRRAWAGTFSGFLCCTTCSWYADGADREHVLEPLLELPPCANCRTPNTSQPEGPFLERRVATSVRLGEVMELHRAGWQRSAAARRGAKFLQPLRRISPFRTPPHA